MCVCVCLSSLVCVVGYFYVRWCSILALWVFFFLLNWMFQHDCLDTYCFWVSYMHAFSIFVLAPVQRNWACFTWKSALEIRSLLLLLLLIFFKSTTHKKCFWNVKALVVLKKFAWLPRTLKSAVKCKHFHYARQSMLLFLVNPVTQVSLCVDCAYICAFLFYSILF